MKKPPQGMMRWRLILAVFALSTVFCSGCGLFNNDPVITGLEADNDCLCPAESCRIHAVAFDEDGDELTYQWSVTGGNITGQGPTVIWTAPDTAATYTITVEVADGRGGKASMQLSIGVVSNSPPVIESLTAEPQMIKATESTTVECVAFDADGHELTYQWSATGGNISGQGHAITWEAPVTCGVYVVTVTVADGRGGEASQELGITVLKPG